VNAGNAISPLANRIDTLNFTYIKADGTTTLNASQAQKVKVTVTVTLPPVGRQGQPGYQPPSQTQLVSEVVLRNAALGN
jgi:hypothetical protein